MINDTIIPEIKNAEEISKNYLRLIKEATQKSNLLPNHGEDFDFVSSFEEYQHISSHLGSKILNMMQVLMKRNKLRGNIDSYNELMSMDDRFDVLVDANDQLFERISTKIDESKGIKKDTSLVVISRTPKSTSSPSTNNATPKSFAYSLLTAKNISRPQQYFRDKIDNTNNPFIPKLKTKPNSMTSFEDSIKTYSKDGVKYTDFLFYENPYKTELESFKPDNSFLQIKDPMIPEEIDDLEMTIIEEEAQLSDLCSKLQSVKEIAVDLEAHSFRSYQGFTCLMQISTRDADYIIDTLALRHVMHKLNNFFTDPSVLKVFHGADMDILWLQRDFGLYVVNMFDTHQASCNLGLQSNSLAYVLKHYCNRDVDKKYQLADWRIRPLPKELIKYAREDTHYLLYVYDCMKKDLIQRSNGTTFLLEKVFDKSTDICKRTYEKPQIHETSYREMFFTYQSKNCLKTMLNAQQMEALKLLYSWRDRIARIEDESTGYVLPNHMLLQIAEHLPKESEGVLACCKPIPPFVKRELFDIHQIIIKARDPALITQNDSDSKVKLKPTTTLHSKFHNLLHCPHDFSHRVANDDNNEDVIGDNALVGDNASLDVSIFKQIPILDLSLNEDTKHPVNNFFESLYYRFLPAQILDKIKLPQSFKEEKIEKWIFLPATKIHEEILLPKPIFKTKNPAKETVEVEIKEESIRDHIKKKHKVKEADIKFVEEVPTKKVKEFSSVEPHIYKKLNLHSQNEEVKFSNKNKNELKRKIVNNPHNIEEPDFKPAVKKYSGSHNKCLSYNNKSQANNSKSNWPKH